MIISLEFEEKNYDCDKCEMCNTHKSNVNRAHRIFVFKTCKLYGIEDKNKPITSIFENPSMMCSELRCPKDNKIKCHNFFQY